MHRHAPRLLPALAATLVFFMMTVGPAEAAEVTNGSFEDGLDGWTTDFETDNGLWDTTDGLDDVDQPPCPDFAALTRQGDSDSNILYQDIELESGMTHTLSFQYGYVNDNTDNEDPEDNGFFTPDSLSTDDS